MVAQLKTPHFWIMFIAICLGAALETNLIPAQGIWHQVSMAGVAVLAAYGYQSGARWSPTPSAGALSKVQIPPPEVKP